MTTIIRIMLIGCLIATTSSTISAQDNRAPAAAPATTVDGELSNADKLLNGAERDIDGTSKSSTTVDGLLSNADELAKEVQHDIECARPADQRASKDQPSKC
jgi:hypothetical protein